MKTLLFMQTSNNQINNHYLNHYLNINVIGVGDGSTGNMGTVYMLTSDIYTSNEMKEKYSSFGTWITASDAYTFGEENYSPFETGDEFSINITKEDLKKQCALDISLLDENKSHSLIVKEQNVTGGITEDEQLIINTFLSERQNILDQYELDKSTFGF